MSAAAGGDAAGPEHHAAQQHAMLLTLLEEFVTVSVQSEIAAIRKEAILALSCCRPCPIESVRQHMLLLLLLLQGDILLDILYRILI